MKRLPKNVQYWDDERSIGNGIFVYLKYGNKFSSDMMRPEHVLSFETPKEALAAAKAAIPCDCEDCKKHIA